MSRASGRKAAPACTGAASRNGRAPDDPTRRYQAAVLGDGRITPITETLGRRQIREIDPLSIEGRQLLAAGRVTLWFDNGARVETRPIHDVLEALDAATRARRRACPRLRSWTVPHDRILERIGQMKKILKPRF